VRVVLSQCDCTQVVQSAALNLIPRYPCRRTLAARSTQQHIGWCVLRCRNSAALRFALCFAHVHTLLPVSIHARDHLQKYGLAAISAALCAFLPVPGG